MITAISLFSGIGGGDIALEMAGVKVLAMCDIDPWCRDILSQHFPDVPLYSDIKEFDSTEYGDIDILLTTFPCQAVSTAGKRLGDKDDRWLWKENLKFIRRNRPIFVIGENVKGILTKGLSSVECDLKSEGYEVRSYLLAGKDIGAIHQRERVFIIGYKARRSPSNTTSIRCNGKSVGGGIAQANEWTTQGENEIECTKRCSEIRSILQPKKPVESWADLPKFRGVDDGLPQKLDKEEKERIKALGNAVMPQQIYPFIKSCVEILNEQRGN